MRARIKAVLVVSVLVAVLWPGRAYACDSFLCIGDVLGFEQWQAESTQRTQIQQDGQTERAQIEQGAAVQIEQTKQDGANLRSLHDAYTKLAEQSAAVQLGQIEAQQQALLAQANTAIEGIHQAGDTERIRLMWESRIRIALIVGLTLLGAVLVIFGRKRG